MTAARLGTTDDLLALIRRSGVIAAQDLDQFLARRQLEGGVPETSRELAGLLVSAGLLTPFQAEMLLGGRWKGFTIAGKYKLLDLLGEGGMGRVYLCEHLRMKRLVALKLLPAEQANKPASVERFDREARAVAALDHPNIVKAYDIDQDGKLHFLVMEYVDGTSLQDIVTRHGPFDPVWASNAVAQAAWGLQHAHEAAGLVHRDVKPGNLLLDRGGTVKILDMGLARFFNDKGGSITKEYDEKSVLGTLDYLSPEQGLDSHNVDIRGDIFSLGSTFYFLLTGQKPFGEGTATQKLLYVQMREPPPLRTVRPDVPEDIEAVIRKMMAKDPDHRHQTPAEVAEALAPWAAVPLPPPPEQWMPAPRSGVTASTRSGANAAYRRGPHSMGGPATPMPGAGSNAPAPRTINKSVAVGAVVAALGMAALFVARSIKTAPAVNIPERVAPVRDAKLLLVDKTGQEGRFPTITAALAQAKPGDRVMVRETPWEEAVAVNLDLTPGGGVVVEGRTSTDGELVTLRPPPVWPDGKPLLSVRGVPGLKFEGFALDGRGVVNDLVALQGNCSGLTFERVELRGFRRTGVKADVLAGSPDPVKFDGVAVVCEEGAAGVRFEAARGRPTRGVQLANCRCDGPGRAAVVFAGPARDVTVARGRFFNLDAGVEYDPAAEPTNDLDGVHFNLNASTFYKVATPLEFLRVPPSREFGPSEVKDNLFVKAERLLVVQGQVPERRPEFVAQTAWNAADPPVPGAAALGAIKVSADDLGVSADNDRTFLRPPSKGSPLLTAAPGGKPVGAPPP